MSRRSRFARLVFLAIAAALLITSPAALAQFIPSSGEESSAGSTEQNLNALIEAARAEGARVIIVDPAGEADSAAAAPPPDQVSQMETRIAGARARLGKILTEAPLFFVRFGDMLHAQRPDGSLMWLFWSLLLGAVFIGIGYWVGQRFRSWGQQACLDLFDENPRTRAEKVGYLAVRALIWTVQVAIVVVVAVALTFAAANLVENAAPAARTTVFALIFIYALVRVFKIVFGSIFAPNVPNHRLVNLSDQDAHRLDREMTLVFAVGFSSVAFTFWLGQLGLQANAFELVRVIAFFLVVALVSIVLYRNRKAIAGVILGRGDPARKPLLLRLFAQVWHVVAILYLLVAWLVQTVRNLVGAEAAQGLIGAPFYAIVLGVVLYALAMIVIDRIFKRRRAAGGEAEEEEEEEPDAVEAAVERDIGIRRPAVRTYKGLAERATGIVAFAIALWFLFDLWGLDLTQPGGLFNRLWGILLVGLIFWLIWQTIRIAFDRKIEAEGGYELGEPGDEGGSHKTASRLATLLPLFRNTLLITLVVIFGMIALSELGVDIAPLFAGAGVVGLAIGFGAQTLIRDIFSGAFFLIDDAFRKGEYIDIGSVKGTVEQISIRSMKLRHHMGPLHTVPFGSIVTLTNYSRDWVMMKLPLRLTYDADVEHVRKLIKKLGQELLEDPEIGDKFLEPLKSQGVYQMEDAAMVIRVKFMTKPGDQFQVRKKVYTRIRELFEKEKIRLGQREVTVRVAGQQPGQEPPPEAVAAGADEAVRMVEGKPQGGGDDR